MKWDPEIDAPATIAIIGGGPLGIEAALYARFLGYSVIVFESTKIASSWLPPATQTLQENVQQACSTLGLAALEAQDVPLPESDTSSFSVSQFLEGYILPLARSDLLYESIKIQSKVVSISRTLTTANIPTSDASRAELEFRLLIDSKQRGEYSQLADIIIDCGGLSSRAGLASGGGLASGEKTLAPDNENYQAGPITDDSKFPADSHIVLWGDSPEACQSAISLQHHIQSGAIPKVTWLLPQHLGSNNEPFSRAPEELKTACCELIARTDPSFVVLKAWGIESIRHSEEQGFTLRAQMRDDEFLDLTGDYLINCSERIPNWDFWPGSCPTTDFREFELDARVPISPCTCEPHYYVVGSKSSPYQPLSLAESRQQIRWLFALVGGRRELDLYETVRPKDA